MAEGMIVAQQTEEQAEVIDEDIVVDDVLIEEVSIDGMCGVY